MLRDRAGRPERPASPPSVPEKEGESLIVRLSDLKSQSAASDVLRDTVGEKYTVALNLASTVPDWLANPAVARWCWAWTCRAACISCCRSTRRPASERLDAYTEDVRSTLRDARIRTSRWNAVPTTASWPT